MTKQLLRVALGLILVIAPISLVGCGEPTPAPVTPAPTVEAGKTDPGPGSAAPKPTSAKSND